MRSTKLLFLFLPIISVMIACNNDKSMSCMDEEKLGGAIMKSFYNPKGNLEAIIVTEHDSSIVVIPTTTMARQKNMSDDEYQCLKKCKKADGSYDLNCILLCPVTKKFSVATMAVKQ